MKLLPKMLVAALSLTASLHAAPTITGVGSNPAAPTNFDSVTVSANVQPSAGTTISQVQLTYGVGAVTTGTAMRETMTSTATTTSWNGTGAQNAWTVTATRNAGDVKQRSTTANHTVPVVLTSGATTTGSTSVTCASTANVWPGMSLSGTNIPAGTTIATISNATTLVLSAAATGTGTGLSLTAAGVTLTNCTTTTGSPNVSCLSTTGLVVGMGITGVTTNPNNPTVQSITDGANFVLSANVTTGSTGLTLTASGCGVEMNTGTSDYNATMITTTNAINAGSASAGNVEFCMRTSDLIAGNGWTFQISPDGGTTWNTRLSENYAGSTVSLTNCTLNATTTVTCASTSGLAAGMTVQGAAVRLNNCGTTSGSPTVTCADTTGLAVGMYISANGVPNNTRVISMTANTSFTLSGNANATATVSALANYLSANTTIASVTNGTTFVLSATPFYSGSSLSLDATTVNHGFTLKHYDLAAAEMTSGMKMRFQFSGYNATAPARQPVCDVDDIVVTLTTGNPPVTLAMQGEGSIYSASIPAQTGGTTVTYSVSAQDSALNTTTSGNYSYTVASVAPVLSVSPAAGLTATGALGGSVTTNATYTLVNTGTGTLSWTAGKTAEWLTLSSTSGTLAANSSTSVTASINGTARSLAAGTYSDTITFTNATSGAGTATRAASLTIVSAPAAPVLSIPAIAFAQGSSKTLSWAAVAGAAGYTVQIAATADFAAPLASQTVTSPTASFANLTDGATYYYRVLATNVAGSSAYSNVISFTQDNTPPTVAITSPATGGTTAVNTVTVTGTSSDTPTGVTSVRVNNVLAATSNGFATWTATVPLGFGTNAITATAFDKGGNATTTLPVIITLTTAQTYNPLYIPPVMTGTTFNLTLDTSSKQFFTGPLTSTYAYNHGLFWGPTLIMKKGDFVRFNLTNNLPDTTTTHWHGFHIPAIMDGGPHETIPAGTTWSPSFYIKNNAATYWYHPHLHTTTQLQLTMGAGGLIIIQDDEEAALTLPRTYGVDDFPIVLTSRRTQGAGNNANQFATNGAFGDFMLVNGTVTPQVSLPAQIVRLRILNAEIARNHNLGFSDNRTFYVIGTDGGLLNAPVPVTRMVMACAERYEILVDLRGVTPGTTLDLMTYNSNQAAGYSGGQPGTTGANGSLLNNIDFVDLHINVVAASSNPVATIPTTLANNVYWTSADVTNNRTVSITGVGGNPLSFDNLVYSPSVINQNVNFNAVEQWTLSNVSNLSHSFHIHDIQFYITSMPGGVPAYMQGWKDTFYTPQQSNISFITRFDDFASNSNPFMFHCHFLQHEDGGLMGQFLVRNNAIEDLAVASFTRKGADPAVTLQVKSTPGTTYTLQYSPDMTTGSWIDVGSVTSDGSSVNFTETDSGRLGQGRGFYRVIIPTITQ